MEMAAFVAEDHESFINIIYSVIFFGLFLVPNIKNMVEDFLRHAVPIVLNVNAVTVLSCPASDDDMWVRLGTV